MVLKWSNEPDSTSADEKIKNEYALHFVFVLEQGSGLRVQQFTAITYIFSYSHVAFSNNQI
jgi:hypothetical protein